MTTVYTLEALTLVPASPEQLLVTRRRTFIEWGRNRTEEQYVERDVIMDAHEHALGGKMTTWVLVPRDDIKTLDFMCSCETFRRDSIVVRKTSSHAPGVLEDVKGYGIASVYTPVSKRKNGYARHMMRLLHWVLAPHSSLPAEAFVWGAPPQPTSSTGNATFSVLYSDVGPDFYHGCGPDGVPRTGWAANGAVHTAWNVGAQASREQGTTAEWKWLSKDDVVQLYENEAEAMKQDVVASAPIGTSFSFLPNNGVGLFNINRTMVFEENSIVPILLCESWGVSLVKSNDVSPTFATWTLDARNHGTALVITRLRVQPAGLADLLAQVQEVALGINAYSVEAWNLSEDLKAEAARIGGTTEERKDHLPAYKWYGKETNDEVHWLFNEKFAWC